MIIRAAQPADIPEILRLRTEAAAWLHGKGSDQWGPTGDPLAKVANDMTKAIHAGHAWMGCTDANDSTVGTMTVNKTTDPGTWSDHEIATALFVHRMMIDRRYAGQGFGRDMFAFAEKLACLADRAWLRFDAWSSSKDLHAYYQRLGFRLARIADVTPPSGALFERSTGIAPE